MQKIARLGPVVLLILVLSGCLSRGITPKQQTPYPSEIQVVQSAVDQYRKKTGVLPIENRDQKTPIYLKYPIDFKRLIPGYLPEAPENAYDNGGIFQYVLVTPEKNPTVKLIDLTTVAALQKLQRRILIFKREHGFPPFGEVIVRKRYTIDYEVLGYDTPPFVNSPFTGKDLGFVIGVNGKVHIDYRKDLYAYLKEYGGNDYTSGEDIRSILVKHSPFVPAYSFPYTVNEASEPVFLVQ